MTMATSRRFAEWLQTGDTLDLIHMTGDFMPDSLCGLAVRRELANRGVGDMGAWVGFRAAENLWLSAAERIHV